MCTNSIPYAHKKHTSHTLSDYNIYKYKIVPFCA